MNLNPKDFADIIADAIETATEPLLKRIITLEQRLSQIEVNVDVTDAVVVALDKAIAGSAVNGQ